MKDFCGNAIVVVKDHIVEHKEAYALGLTGAFCTLFGGYSWVLFPKAGVLVNGSDVFALLVQTTGGGVFGATIGETYKRVTRPASANTESAPLAADNRLGSSYSVLDSGV